MEQRDLWILLFILGSVLLNWPMLSLFKGADGAFADHTTLVYITAVWLLIILSAYLFDRWTSH
ncbi:MAG: hypothetical protein WBK88_03180 [Methanothrix sp.]